ncbi:MAG: hypothetical protein M1837_005661 [Sclerophora amabilis]|nr:MAG: hypothetical protein M1837_005661 [Sclerophora amabilis]
MAEAGYYRDPLLDQLANAANLAVLSIGYRLAPEDPFPAGPEDCYDSAEWLAENAKARFGAELKFMGGESAGGHLAVLTSLHLLRTQPTFQLSGGLLLSYGCYDLSLLPSARNFSKPLVLSPQIMAAYMEAFLPGLSHEQRRHPSISPMFADLGLAIQGVGPEGKQKQLPAALFICGTEDCLLDDTLMMGIKWLSSGGEAVVKIMPGAPHGFTLFETSQVGVSAEAAVVVKEWLGERLE